MDKLYMGIDVGSVSAKGVIIDEYNNIITSSYSYTFGRPIDTVKEMVKSMKNDLNLEKYQVVAVGVTGSARRLIGLFLGSTVIKNELMAGVVGTLRLYPDVRTIFEIGGIDSKFISVNNGVVVDYTICNDSEFSNGFFLDILKDKFNMNIDEVNKIIDGYDKKNNKNIGNNYFSLKDLFDKVQDGYNIDDILYDGCNTIALNYVNRVLKGKKIISPIVFNGGVGKNKIVVDKISKLIGADVVVNKNSHLINAIGIAIMARESGVEDIFDFNIDNYKLDTVISNCSKCEDNCEIVTVYKNNNKIDLWGCKCNIGNEIKNM